MGGRYVSAEFGPRAENALQRRLAKGEYTLYPAHLAAAGFTLTHDEVGDFALARRSVTGWGSSRGCLETNMQARVTLPCRVYRKEEISERKSLL
jgi:hypothetical protein